MCMSTPLAHLRQWKWVLEIKNISSYLHAPTTTVRWSAEGTFGDTVVDISDKLNFSSKRPKLSHSKSPEEWCFFLPSFISESLEWLKSQNLCWVNWTSVKTHILNLTSPHEPSSGHIVSIAEWTENTTMAKAQLMNTNEVRDWTLWEGC